MDEQVDRAAKRVGLRRTVLDDTVRADRVFVEDEAAADRIIGRLAKRLSRCIDGGEGHAVGVIGQGFAPMHDQVIFFVELDRKFAEQLEHLRRANLLQARVDAVGVHAFGQLALESEHDRLVAAVALAGGAERTEQLGADTGHAREQAVVAQFVHELAGGPHRTHGVGARWTDADRKQVEYADGHRRMLLQEVVSA